MNSLDFLIYERPLILMNQEFKDSIIYGAISFSIAVIVTFVVAQVYLFTGVSPDYLSEALYGWVLPAVGIASFFSGFFTAYFKD